MSRHLIICATGQIEVMEINDAKSTPEKQFAAWVAFQPVRGTPERLPATMVPVPPGFNPEVQDRTFRNAWRHVAGAVVVDMPEARKIAAEKSGLSLDDPAIKAATTPEELKAVMPKVLK